MNSCVRMENEKPNNTTIQLIAQHISEAIAKSFSTPHQYGEAILLFNNDLLCIEANITACELTGYSKPELFTLHLKDLFHRDEPSQPIPNAATLQAAGQLVWERKMQAKNGHAWYAVLTLQAMANDCILTYVSDITSHKRTEFALQQSEEKHQLLFQQSTHEFFNNTTQLRELSDHLLNIREAERTNIAREIHDELGQQLTILKMDVSWLHQKLQKYNDDALLQKTTDTLQLLNETIKTVRRIATELRPSMLDDLGLIEAIEWQSKEFEKRSGISIAFESTTSHLPVSTSVATSLFRIYQEALTNIARHANAKNVFSKLQLENEQVVLTIKDDGIGFDMQTLALRKTLGLLGMQERTLMIGGQFEVCSKPGRGTTIKVTASLQSEDPLKLQPGQ